MNRDPETPVVLVVDDDPEELASNCEVLASEHAVLSALSGEEALRMARESKPAAIVLDVVMPGGKDGYTVFRELREDPTTRDIPVIFLTGVNRTAGLAFGAKELERYLGVAPAAFLEKPIRPEELVRVVGRIVQGVAASGRVAARGARNHGGG